MGSDVERQEAEAQVKLLEARVTMERQNKTSIGDINEYAFIRSDKTSTAQTAKPAAEVKTVVAQIDEKYDWYQNATHVFVTFKVKGDKELAKNTKVDYQTSSISLLASNGQNIKIQLAGEIKPSESSSNPG